MTECGSSDTGAGAAELNEALYSAISAGADTGHAVDLVAVAVKAARGGFTDTETAVDGLTSALNAYAMETADAEGLANKFLVTQNLGKTTFGALAGSIGNVAPTANAAGESVDELLASVASLTANGIGTSEAMTGMKAALSNIIKPTGEAGKLAEGIVETLPELAQTGTDIILQLAQSIIDGLPGMVPAAVQTIASLVEQITGNLSQIIDAGIQVIVALGEGIIEALPDLITKVPEIVSNIANVINDNAPKLLLAAGKLILELGKGLIESIPVLIENIPKIIGAVVDAWSAFNWLELGTKAITAVKDGILKLIPAVKTAGWNVLDAVVNAVKALPKTLADLGRELGQSTAWELRRRGAAPA